MVEDIAALCEEPINEIGFIIGDFGDAVEKQLIAIAESLGAAGKIYYQTEALGTGHRHLLCKRLLCPDQSLLPLPTLYFGLILKLMTVKKGSYGLSPLKTQVNLELLK